MRIGLSVANFTWPSGAPASAPRPARWSRTAERPGSPRSASSTTSSRSASSAHPKWTCSNPTPRSPSSPAAPERGRTRHAGHWRALSPPRPAGQDRHHPRRPVGRPRLLGIGAGWNEARAAAWACPSRRSPNASKCWKRRSICHQMWRGDETPFVGNHYQLDAPLKCRRAWSRPHPPILVGGSRKRRRCAWSPATRRMQSVPTPNLGDKLDDAARALASRRLATYDAIEKTRCSSSTSAPTANASTKRLARSLARRGRHHHGAFGLKDVHTLRPLEVMAERVIPVVSTWGATAAVA